MQYNYDIFEQYLNGELKGQALSDFEDQLTKDPALANELELFRKVRKGVTTKVKSHSGKEALLKTITDIEGPYFKDGEQSSDSDAGGGPRLISRRFMLTAVAVAASILLLVFVWQPWQDDLPLYDQYAQFPVAELTSRSTDAVDVKAMEDAYNSKNYSTAVTLFDQYLAQNRDDAEILLLNGISNLNLGDYDRAMAILARVVSGNSAFKNDARWYLALTYLKQDNIERTIQFLEAIPEGADKYQSAQDLLGKIQKSN